MRVFVPSQLRGYTSGSDAVTATGTTLGEVLDDLDRQFPGLRFRVIDEQDRVRPYIVLFVGESRETNLSARLPEGADLTIMGALSGG